MPPRGYEFYLRASNSVCHSFAGYLVEHEKTKFISKGGHVIFFLWYKHTYKEI